MEIIIALVVGVFLASAFFMYFKKKDQEKIGEIVNDSINKAYSEALNKATKNLIMQSAEKLDSEKKEIKTDLSNKNQMFEKLVSRMQEELDRSNKKLDDYQNKSNGMFGQIQETIKDTTGKVDDLRVTTEGLKSVLSNNQLRGQFGEQVAENLLKMAGFTRGVDYEYNKAQDSASSRPDFTVFLPDKVKINIDSKFPYQNLQKVSETQDKHQKNEFMKKFETDIKNKIKQVTTREYINPDDNTVDFVILFIPNEMIFSYIYDQMNDIWVDAMKKKVIFAGPFSFTAILRMVKQAYDNFNFQKNIRQIISYIKNFQMEFEKYNEEFKKIGDRITSLDKQFHEVDSTRSNKLIRIVDKIRIESKQEEKLIE